MDVTELLIQYGMSGVGTVLLAMWISGKLRPERDVKEMREDRDFWRSRALHHLDLADRATTVSSAALLPVTHHSSEQTTLDQILDELQELKRGGRAGRGGRPTGGHSGTESST